MRTATMAVDEARVRLNASVLGLVTRAPEVSAKSVLSRGQRRVVILCGAVLVGGAVVDARMTVTILVGLVTVLYLAIVIYRAVLFARANRQGVVIRISDEDARGIPDHALPVYTVLVPVFHEAPVVPALIANLERIEYPSDRLDIKLLVEEDDDETIEAVVIARPGDHFQMVVVPPAEPRTKPKAMNFGLSLAEGEIVAIFDAEDVPDPLQLRRAVIALRAHPEMGCVQSKLSYYNPSQNVITKWFTLEYAMWFSFFLPGLAAVGAPIPLGGTSNHFRARALRAMGAWDPFNVTEDADLGIRMHRERVRVGILESTTYEEANSDFVNWVRQRSRWYKGYLQTFCVHLRAPRTFVKEVGWRGLGHFCLFVGGTPLMALLNPVFWVLTVLWFSGRTAFIQSIFPAPVYYTGLVCFTLGNFLFVYLTLLSSRFVRQGEYVVAALLVPIYWIMMAMAAVKAMWQFVGAPSLWEKTFHGLHEHNSPEMTAVGR